MPERPTDETGDGSSASAKADERPTVRPFPQRVQSPPSSPLKEEASHERVRPQFGPFMSAFANHLATSQPPLEVAAADGTTGRSLLVKMSRFFAQGDFDGALALADAVATTHDAHDVVSYCARTCRTELEGNFRERLGGLDHTPRKLITHEETLTVDLDHREAFLLSQIDGQTSYEALVDVSPLPRFVTLHILERLRSFGVIE